MKVKSLIFFVLIMGAVVTSFAQEKATKASLRKKAPDSTMIRQQIQNTALFIEAKRQEILGNLDAAAKLFKQVTDREPENDAAYYELANIAVQQNDVQSAINNSKKAVSIDPDNKWYELQLAELYKSIHRFDESEKIFKTLIRLEPDNLDYRLQLAMNEVLAGDYKEAIDEYHYIEGEIGVTEEISLQLQKIYLHLNKIDDAVGEAKKLITSDPDDSRYYSILAELYMTNNMPDKAYEVYQGIVKKFPNDPYVHISLSDYYRKKGDANAAFKELEQGFANPNLDIDTKIQILLAYYSASEDNDTLRDQATLLSKIVVDTHPKDPKAYAMYADFLVRDERYKEARDAFHQVIALDSSKFLVWQGLLQVEAQLSDYKAMERESKRVIGLFPYQPLGYFFNGVANLQLKNYKTAIIVLNQGKDFIVDNDPLLAQFYAYLGDANNQIKDNSASDAAYEESLSLDSNNSYVLNNYAYYLSLRGVHLEKAEKMARKATQIDTANSANEDTYGWVLYKMGHYRDAAKWIRKALDDGGNSSAVILEHYGDVLFKLDDKAGALEYWEKAKKSGPASDLLDKKIKEGRLFE